MDSKFKVIVVGGGPVGLTAAHCLSRAAIDFVLLERRSTPTIQTGANLVLMATGMRILGQLGLADAMADVSSTLCYTTRQDHDGNDMWNSNFFKEFLQNLGPSPMTASRHDISKVLYESLPPAAKACIEVDRNVTSVAVDADGSGASVTCADGTTYHGSVVIGADGVHSMVRRHIGAERRGTPLDAEEPFESRFRCLWIRFPTDLCAALQPGDSSETHGPGASTQMFAGPETAVTAVYERLPGPTRQRARYTQADEEALVERWGHLPIMAGRALTIRRAYESRTSASLLNLEEGVVEDWSARGRLVLIGDSAHKFTPNTGSGCNQGILDAVALANQLHKAIEESAGGAPSTERLDKAFGDYQDERKPGVTTHCSRSGYSAVVSTWSSALLGFADRWIFCWAFFLALIIHRASVREAKMPVLRFVQGEERYQGKIPWVNKIPPVQS